MCGGIHAKFQDSRTNNKKSPQPFQSIGQIRENNSVSSLANKASRSQSDNRENIFYIDYN